MATSSSFLPEAPLEDVISLSVLAYYYNYARQPPIYCLFFSGQFLRFVNGWPHLASMVRRTFLTTALSLSAVFLNFPLK